MNFISERLISFNLDTDQRYSYRNRNISFIRQVIKIEENRDKHGKFRRGYYSKGFPLVSFCLETVERDIELEISAIYKIDIIESSSKVKFISKKKRKEKKFALYRVKENGVQFSKISAKRIDEFDVPRKLHEKLPSNANFRSRDKRALDRRRDVALTGVAQGFSQGCR